MSDSNSSSGGIGFFGALALLFIGLKLGNVIDWPWPVVLMPLWGPPAFALAVVAAMGALAVPFIIYDYFVDGRKRRPSWLK